MSSVEENSQGGRFHLPDIVNPFPDSADTMLLDHYLCDKEEASTRVFCAYRDVPLHYHTQCDEVLYVLSGEANFWIDKPVNEALCKPGDLIIFRKNTVHSISGIIKGPVVCSRLSR